MKKITTKNQFELARFLGKSLRHVHKWVKLMTGKRRNKRRHWIVDDTGGFIQCSICEEVIFLNPKQVEKYKKLTKEGYEIKILNNAK